MRKESINPHKGLGTLCDTWWTLNQPSTSLALGFDHIGQENEYAQEED